MKERKERKGKERKGIKATKRKKRKERKKKKESREKKEQRVIRMEERFQMVAVRGMRRTPVADFNTFRMSRHSGWKTVLFLPAG
jgi:hypothetical protein